MFAQVTPSYDASGSNLIGYHSLRCVPHAGARDVVAGLYKAILAEEQKHASPKDGMDAGLSCWSACSKRRAWVTTS